MVYSLTMYIPSHIACQYQTPQGFFDWKQTKIHTLYNGQVLRLNQSDSSSHEIAG